MTQFYITVVDITHNIQFTVMNLMCCLVRIASTLETRWNGKKKKKKKKLEDFKTAL